MSSIKPRTAPRVAFISSMEGEPWGGSEELWSQAALRLLKEGCAVAASVKAWDQEAATIRQLRDLGCLIKYRRHPTRVERVMRRVSPERPYAWLDEFKPKLAVISQGANLDGFAWMEACLKRRIPYVTVAQAATPAWWPRDTEIPRVTDALRRGLACFFVSRANLELTEWQLAARLSNAEIIRNPFRVPYERPQPWPENKCARMACVAALEPNRKGQDLLFGAMSSTDWADRPVKLTMYGRGSSEQGLRGLKDFLNLAIVDFGGFAEPADIWAREQLLVLPSRSEGLPIVLVEAMLSGRPAVVTDVGGNREVVEDGVTGFIATAPTAPLIADALERAWNMRERWPVMGAEAAARIRNLIPPDPVACFVKQIRQFCG